LVAACRGGALTALASTVFYHLVRMRHAGTLCPMRCLIAPLAVFGFLAGAPLARADIFAFTDAGGVTHFSNVPADSRFKLLVASPAEPMTASGNAHIKDWLGSSAKYDAVIAGAAAANTVQPALVRALIVVESGFNPRAVSKKGAIGLMQLLPATAKRYGVKDAYDPEQNIRAGTHYLKDLLARFDSNLELALAAYNAGEQAVERHGRHVPPFAETMNYVPNVMRVYQRLAEQARAART
jgi:soluble lytic murein transglycosylase-like protein